MKDILENLIERSNLFPHKFLDKKKPGLFTAPVL